MVNLKTCRDAETGTLESEIRQKSIYVTVTDTKSETPRPITRLCEIPRLGQNLPRLLIFQRTIHHPLQNITNVHDGAKKYGFNVLV